jgi:hypothetical protein
LMTIVLMLMILVSVRRAPVQFWHTRAIHTHI